MSEKQFDPAKPVQTRDGRPARIICTDRKDSCEPPYKIMALVTEANGGESVSSYHADGSYGYEGDFARDLINIPTKRERWVNLYRSSADYYSSKDNADARSDGRITCVRIEWEE